MNLRIVGHVALFSTAALLAAVAGCSDDSSTSSSNGGSGGTGAAGGASSSSQGGSGGTGPSCGDGTIDAMETCDDGNTAADDGCDASCQTEGGWDCTGEPSACTEICQDGMVVGAEGCDDGNADLGDGCDDQCAVETGFDCMGSPSTCAPICGDGIIIGFMGGGGGAGGGGTGGMGTGGMGTGGMGMGVGGAGGGTGGMGMGGGGGAPPMGPMELCDDGNTTAGDGCSDTCMPEMGWDCSGEPTVCNSICGDGMTVGAETCDDGNQNNNDGCPDGNGGTCMTAACGDGFIYNDGGTEVCDDGNMADMDGCDMMCAVESGFLCNSEPSVCAPGESVSATGIAADFGDTGFPQNYCHNLTFSNSGTVDGPVELTVGLDHTWVGDLQITITSPSNTTTILMDMPGTGTYGDSSNLLATSPITFLATGTYDADNMGVNLPSTDAVVCQDDMQCDWFPNPGSMAAFNGETVAGTWTICFNDSFATADPGLLQSITLTMSTMP